jgi:hypothetical protein
VLYCSRNLSLISQIGLVQQLARAANRCAVSYGARRGGMGRRCAREIENDYDFPDMDQVTGVHHQIDYNLFAAVVTKERAGGLHEFDHSAFACPFWKLCSHRYFQVDGLEFVRRFLEKEFTNEFTNIFLHPGISICAQPPEFLPSASVRSRQSIAAPSVHV